MISKSGSLESCDCLIMLYENTGIEIEIESDVLIQYGKQIEHIIRETLEENNINDIRVAVNDKGALDYTIKSRLLTALKRGELL